VDVGEGAVGLALPDGGAYGFHDDCVTHGAGLLGRTGSGRDATGALLPVSRKSELTITRWVGKSNPYRWWP
jgi:hypothetical protein